MNRKINDEEIQLEQILDENGWTKNNLSNNDEMNPEQAEDSFHSNPPTENK